MQPPRLVLYLGDRPLARAVEAWLQADPACGTIVGTLWADQELPEEWQADLGVSVQFRRILRAPELARYPRGVVNLHTGYLPWNRGAMPNVWPILDGSPAGVTLHYLDEGVDTGPLVARQQVAVEPWDTGETLYHKLEEAAFTLFCETWPKVLAAPNVGLSQALFEPGTSHRANAVEVYDRLRLDDEVTVGSLIDVLRARTFPPHRGCYFVDEQGRKVYLRLSLEVEG